MPGAVIVTRADHLEFATTFATEIDSPPNKGRDVIANAGSPHAIYLFRAAFRAM
jgi:hypothetical protein